MFSEKATKFEKNLSYIRDFFSHILALSENINFTEKMLLHFNIKCLFWTIT